MCVFVSEKPQRSPKSLNCAAQAAFVTRRHASVYVCVHMAVYLKQWVFLWHINTCVYVCSMKHLTNYIGKCDFAESTMYKKSATSLSLSLLSSLPLLPSCFKAPFIFKIAYNWIFSLLHFNNMQLVIIALFYNIMTCSLRSVVTIMVLYHVTMRIYRSHTDDNITAYTHNIITQSITGLNDPRRY